MEMYMGEYSWYLERTKSRFLSTTRDMLYDDPVLSKVDEERRGRLMEGQCGCAFRLGGRHTKNCTRCSCSKAVLN